jgi:hypothetical protein
VIPTVDEIHSDPLVHRPSDLFNPPALTNFAGCVQAAVDPVALWNLNFPPLACGEVASGQLFVDGRLFAASGEPVTFRWFPDRIERAAAWRGLEIETTTVLAWRATAAVVRIRVRNASGQQRRTHLALGIQGGISRVTDPWHQAQAPVETPPPATPDGMEAHTGPAGIAQRTIDRQLGAIVHVAPSGAASVQGAVPAESVDERRIGFELDLAPGETWEASYVHAVGDDPDSARELYRRLTAHLAAELARVRDEWNAELRAIFTPGNDRYSGSLPVLETADADLRRLYHVGVLGVAYFKRESAHSAVGRAYDTLMPRYWATTTFLWDYSLSGVVHALLDPAEMRGQLERWMGIDMHACYGTDWLTGRPLGIWYSVNDHAMTSAIHDYLRWTGARDWLDSSVRAVDGTDATVADHLARYATAWRGFASESGLADYGGIGNLLECVSSYVHEVAALNAANVWNLRVAASHLGARDPAAADADAMRAEAAGLADRLWTLYADGEGWFNARQPDGRLLAVRHCYDLIQVLGLLGDEISAARRAEMVGFLRGQLLTPNWMRALSPEDPDAITSVRPDHQWNGAYTAWPAAIAAGLFRIGEAELASGWLRGLARTSNQGLFGQAHFVDEFAPPESGGALKASSEWPYINDWACSSGGAWARLIIESVFGVTAGLDGITAVPQLDLLDPDARLVGLPYQGRLYTVDRGGIRASE